jgi:integrase
MKAIPKGQVEIMLMTGIIFSEIAALRRSNITETHIVIESSEVKGVIREGGKTNYRTRKIPITTEIAKRLKAIFSRSRRDRVFTMKNGKPINSGDFREGPWSKALTNAGVEYRRPYCLRHTYAEWSLIAGVHIDRLYFLMGHANRTMVYERYGKYVDGIEKDAEKIKGFFGSDYYTP